MKKLKNGETETIFDNNGNELASCGLVESPNTKMTLKTYIESGKSNIFSIEEEIRKFCFTNNIKIVKLESKKIEWLMRRLYIQLEGDFAHLNTLKTYLMNLTDE